MIVRITEQRITVVEVSYDIDVPDHVFHESKGESVEDYRDDWTEVHRETLRSHREVLSIEPLN